MLVYPQNILHQRSPITLLEMFNVLIAVRLWGHMWARQNVLLFSDNAATIATLQSGRAHQPFLRAAAREIWLLAALYDVPLDTDQGPPPTWGQMMPSLELTCSPTSYRLSEHLRAQEQNVSPSRYRYLNLRWQISDALYWPPAISPYRCSLWPCSPDATCSWQTCDSFPAGYFSQSPEVHAVLCSLLFHLPSRWPWPLTGAALCLRGIPLALRDSSRNSLQLPSWGTSLPASDRHEWSSPLQLHPQTHAPQPQDFLWGTA